MAQPTRVQTRPAIAIRWKACLVSAFLLLPSAAATSAQSNLGLGARLCAEREMLLQTLVEAQGPMPNAASAILVEGSIDISRARAACSAGQFEDALTIYDRFVGAIARSRNDREATSSIGQAH